MHAGEAALRLGVALRCSKPKQPPRLGNVFRPTFTVVVHASEIVLRLGVALRCGELKQPPRLGKVLRPAFAVVVHPAELGLRLGLRRSISRARTSRPQVFANIQRAPVFVLLGREFADQRLCLTWIYYFCCVRVWHRGGGVSLFCVCKIYLIYLVFVCVCVCTLE